MKLQLQIKREFFHEAREAVMKLAELALFGAGGEISFAAIGGNIVVSAGGGVATRYLDNYLGWWRMIDRMGETLTPLTCIAAALPQAST